MGLARFKIEPTRLDFSKEQEATIEIDRCRGLFHVRPKGRRRTYCLPLSTVAKWVVHSVLRAEAGRGA